jgi:DtxR family Mn-dependent transcriptional regulator
MLNQLLLSAMAAACIAAGMLWWQRTRSASARRRQVEDALKHLFDREYRGGRGSIPALSETLGLSPRGTAAVVARMRDQLLVTVNGDALALTPDGNRLALHIVRAHRLLERYFADEAGLPLRQVHAAAERLEHAVSPADVNRLSAAMGHPRRDPHGDPIPTRDGVLAPPHGAPATTFPRQTTGRIVHLEDEPEIAFAQIVAAGLRLGQVLRVIDATADRVVMSDGENEYALAPAVAANVFLEEETPAAVDPDVRRLSDLTHGEPAEVVGLDEACQGFSRRRLMDLGFTPGARVTPQLRTFAGDPRAYEIRGTLIALRATQASQVLVKPLPAAAGVTPQEQVS